MKIEFENSIRRLSFLCRQTDIKITWINPCRSSCVLSNIWDQIGLLIEILKYGGSTCRENFQSSGKDVQLKKESHVTIIEVTVIFKLELKNLNSNVKRLL